MVLPFGALVLLAAMLLLPGLAVGPSLDAAVFTGIAQQMHGGSALYVDAWDHKPPGVYYLYLAGQAALPSFNPWLVSWVMSVLATAGAGMGVARALAALGARWGARSLAAGAAVAFMAQYLTALGGGLTEPLAALFAAWALVLALSPSGGWTRSAAVGGLLGIATLISFQLAPAVVAVAGLSVASGSAGRRVRSLLPSLTGAAIPWLLTGLALAAMGTLGAAVEAVFGYGAAYRDASAAYGAELSRAPAAWTLLSVVVLVTPAALGALALRRAGDRRPWVLVAMVGWIAVAILLFVYQGRFIAHYAIPLAIPLGVLAGVGVEAAAARWQRSTLARAMLVAPLAASLFVSIAAAVVAGRDELAANQQRGEQVAAAAAYVASYTPSGDTILVWGNQPELYLAADRSPAMRYSFMYPLATAGYGSEDLVREVRSGLERSPPTLIIDAGSAEPGAPGFLPLLIDRPLAREGRELDLLDPLREFVRENYVAVAEINGWPIYRLRAPGAAGLD